VGTGCPESSSDSFYVKKWHRAHTKKRVRRIQLVACKTTSSTHGIDHLAQEKGVNRSAHLLEHRSDGEQTRRMFEEANARFEASKQLLAG
jgi:hypothetical protein